MSSQFSSSSGGPPSIPADTKKETVTKSKAIGSDHIDLFLIIRQKLLLEFSLDKLLSYLDSYSTTVPTTAAAIRVQSRIAQLM